MTKLNGVEFVVKTPVPCETSGKITICIEPKLGGSTLFSKIVFSSGREGEFYCHKFYRRSTIFWYFLSIFMYFPVYMKMCIFGIGGMSQSKARSFTRFPR